MAKVDPSISLAIASLKRSELEILVLKAASKDKVFHDYLLVNYGDTESGEKDLYEQAHADLNIILAKRHKGFSDELKMVNALQACNKRIEEFSKACKNKKIRIRLSDVSVKESLL